MGHLASFFDKADLYIVIATVLSVLWLRTWFRSTRVINFDHFWQNFDKILAVFIFFVMLGFLTFVLKRGDGTSTQLAWNLVGQVWSSIAILLGVAKGAQRFADNKNGNGNGAANQERASDNAPPAVVPAVAVVETPKP